MDFASVKEAAILLTVNQPFVPPPLLWASVGEGKSSFAEALAHAMGYYYYQLPASQIDPSLVLGIPVADVEEKVTRFFPPEFYASRNLLLLLDEINTAPESVVASVMETVRTRRLGGRVFENLKIILAANPYEQAAGGYILPAPLRNRVVHLQWDFPLDDFFTVTALPSHKRMKESFVEIKVVRPEQIEEVWATVCGWVDGFLTKFPQHYKVKKRIEEERNAFPSPRAWDNVKAILAVFTSVGASDGALYAAVAGCVGEGIAHEFFTYINALDAPSPQDVLNNPQLIDGLRHDILVALLSAIPSLVATNSKLLERAFDVALHFESTGRKDYAYLLARRLLKVCETYKYPTPLRKLSQFKDTAFLKQVKALEEKLKRQNEVNYRG